MPRQSGWRGATVLSRQLQWRGKDFHVEIAVRRGRLCHANACGVAACFGRAADFGAAKSVRFEKKTVLELKIVLKNVKNKKKIVIATSSHCCHTDEL